MTTQPTDTQLRTSGPMMKWLWSEYLSRHKGWLTVAVILMVTEGLTFGSLSIMMQPMFDRIFVGGETGSIWLVGLLILAIFIIRAVTALGQRVIMKYISEKSGAHMRSDLMNHLIGLDTAFHQIHPPGQLIERVQGDVQALSGVWTSLVTGVARDFVAVIGLFSVALWIDWQWMLIAMLGIPVVVIPSFAYDRLMKRRVSTETEASFGQGLMSSTVDIMAGLGFLAVIVYGGSEIIDGEKTVGQFMSFFTAMAIAFDPLRRLANIAGLWQAAAAAIDRLLDVFDTKPTLVSPADPKLPPIDAPRVTFENVDLSYGASGAGKSTLFNVLTRLVEPQSGQVMLNDVAIETVALDALRGRISTVSQDAALFDETLRDNILLGRTDVDEDALQATITAAHVADFLPNLPNGLQSPAGPRGSNLSGGQRQRVAIARALLRDTPILLLDEATSALDTKSEAIVQNALDKLAQGRTTLVIAHRLSTIQNAHKIVVMDQGRVVDQGTHDELLARGGLYADLYRLQFRDGKQVSEQPRTARKSAKPAQKNPSNRSFFARLFRRADHT